MEILAALLGQMPDKGRSLTGERLLDKGQRLFCRGDAPQCMYFVASGEVHLVRMSPAGGEIIFQRAKHGFLAEASLEHSAYHCDAVAVVASRVLTISRPAFRGALEHETFRTIWLHHLSSELRRVRAQSERLGLRSARSRILHFIETEGHDGQITLTHSRKAWAAELGLSHEALYRTLRAMENAGEMDHQGGKIRLLTASGI